MAGERELAQADYARAVALESGDVAFFVQSAQDFAGPDGYWLDAAIANYDRAIELDPNSPDLYMARAELHARQRDWYPAFDDYGYAILRDPYNPEYYIARARAYQLINDDEAALADFTAAVELAPDNGEYYYMRGLAYSTMGQELAAREDLLVAEALGYEQATYRLDIFGQR
ncbi:MAG: tetratricopeptide repeat protein [Chloroflexi bacterium]|nr:tetratricopeptide repeat protein [Chloroflexota bacterium]